MICNTLQLFTMNYILVIVLFLAYHSSSIDPNDEDQDYEFVRKVLIKRSRDDDLDISDDDVAVSEEYMEWLQDMVSNCQRIFNTFNWGANYEKSVKPHQSGDSN